LRGKLPSISNLPNRFLLDEYTSSCRAMHTVETATNCAIVSLVQYNTMQEITVHSVTRLATTVITWATWGMSLSSLNIMMELDTDSTQEPLPWKPPSATALLKSHQVNMYFLSC
jgi:hypothetical protein